MDDQHCCISVPLWVTDNPTALARQLDGPGEGGAGSPRAAVRHRHDAVALVTGAAKYAADGALAAVVAATATALTPQTLPRLRAALHGLVEAWSPAVPSQVAVDGAAAFVVLLAQAAVVADAATLEQLLAALYVVTGTRVRSSPRAAVSASCCPSCTPL